MQSRQICYAMASCLLTIALFFVGCGGGSSQSGNQSASLQSVVRFSSQPGTSANEDDLYTYIPVATDTANGTISFAITQAPDKATLSGSTLSWTPSSAQSRLPNSFTVTATSTAGGSAQQTWSVAPTGVIHGQQIVTWLLEGGDLYASTPNDLTLVPVNAVVPTGSGFLTLPGVGAVDSTFTIAKVPAGHYWLQFGNNYFWTGNSHVDLGFDCLGRPEAAWGLGLTRHIQVAALNPWQSTDYIGWYSTNLASDINVPASLTNGDTLLDDAWSYAGQILDASKGDTAYVTQMVSILYGGVTLNELNKVYQVTGVSEIDGQVNEIGGAGAIFADVPATNSLDGKVKGTAFAALRPGLNPNYTPGGTGFSLEVLPFGSSKGWFGPSPALIHYSGPPLNDDEDTSISYGNPYDSNWPLVFTMNDTVAVAYTVPVVGVVNKHGYTFLNTTTMPTVSQSIAPLVGPVTSPQINGVSFFQDQLLSTSTPTISWNAPSVGTPTEYAIEICRWETTVGNDYACGDYSSFIAQFHTKATSFQIPSGILEPGRIYFVTVVSGLVSGVDMESSPYRLAFPQAGARSLSGLIGVAGGSSRSFHSRYKRLSRLLEQRIEPHLTQFTDTHR